MQFGDGGAKNAAGAQSFPLRFCKTPLTLVAMGYAIRSGATPNEHLANLTIELFFRRIWVHKSQTLHWAKHNNMISHVCHF